MKIVKSFCLTLIVLASSSYSASIELIQELNFTVPMLQGEIIDFDFNDVDGDGFPEILACNDSIWVLYSLIEDSIISWNRMPEVKSVYFPFIPWPDEKVLLDDVDRDGIKDIVVCKYSVPTTVSDSAVALYVYHGYSDFQTFSEFYTGSGSCFGNCAAGQIGILEAEDIDNDGQNELYFSFHTFRITDFVGAYVENTNGRSIIFHSFPDSLANFDYFGQVFMVAASAINDSPLNIIKSVSSNYSELGNDYSAIYCGIGYVDSTGRYSSWNLDFPAFGQCNPNLYYFSEYSENLELGCSGNIHEGLSGVEFVLLKTSRLSCRGNPDYDTSVTTLGLYYVSSLDSIGQIWDVESVSSSYENFIYHPLFPGYFFAFVDDAFTQFRGEDGSVFQFTTNVPTGAREWDYPFDDSIPRLIVKNGTYMSIYNADISTPVYENQPFSLPKSFDLSQPYPNPFNPEVSFTLSVPSRSQIKVEIFNILGRQIETVYDGEVSAGELKLKWNAMNNPSGVYLIMASSKEFVKSVKAVLLK